MCAGPLLPWSANLWERSARKAMALPDSWIHSSLLIQLNSKIPYTIIYNNNLKIHVTLYASTSVSSAPFCQAPGLHSNVAPLVAPWASFPANHFPVQSSASQPNTTSFPAQKNDMHKLPSQSLPSATPGFPAQFHLFLMNEYVNWGENRCGEVAMDCVSLRIVECVSFRIVSTKLNTLKCETSYIQCPPDALMLLHIKNWEKQLLPWYDVIPK